MSDMTFLERIEKPNDIHDIPEAALPVLAEEIRAFLVDHVSKTGGHLASNLGTVELTIALHRVLTFPQDKLVWDVGHQAYTHKILTGRKDGFDTLRQKGGLSGFPKRRESDCDAFDTGHSATSVSAALGIACARDLKGEDYAVCAVIGDGSLTGGMAYEALNNAANLKSNFIIVLNDNGMSISRNVGSMSAYLRHIRTAKGYERFKNFVNEGLNRIPEVGNRMAAGVHWAKEVVKQMVIPGMYFEDMGITYFGPVDGHSIPDLEAVLRDARRVQGPVIVHVRTQKGRGYAPAVREPERFHGIGPFDAKTGRTPAGGSLSWTRVFSETMKAIGSRHPEVAAVTASMSEGTGLAGFAERFPERFFDVGIAEEHAVTFAAGLATQGLVPVVAIYSSFLQRAYDQILHDVCLQDLPVVLAVDRAGLVGNDGETHQGAFDISYLTSVPGLAVMAPKNARELADMMRFAVTCGHPVAVRYPRGAACRGFADQHAPVAYGKAEVLTRGQGTAILALGSMVGRAEEACRLLAEEGIRPGLINLRFAAPLDEETILEAAREYGVLVTAEENVRAGGIGEHIAALLEEKAPDTRLAIVSLPNAFIPQGSPAELLAECGLDAAGIAQAVREALQDARRPEEV